ncbi:MAG: hypothetical protein ACPG7R_08615, partial [Planctomycetota bacterium]
EVSPGAGGFTLHPQRPQRADTDTETPLRGAQEHLSSSAQFRAAAHGNAVYRHWGYCIPPLIVCLYNHLEGSQAPGKFPSVSSFILFKVGDLGY